MPPTPTTGARSCPAGTPPCRGSLKVLPKVIEFGANAEGAAVLVAMEMLPDVLAYRSRLAAPLIPARMIDETVVNGPWKRLVFGHPAHEDGAVNGTPTPSACWSSSTGTSSAARSTPGSSGPRRLR